MNSPVPIRERYDHSELKTAQRYITPGKNARADVYNPLKKVPNIAPDALSVGMLMMERKPEAETEKAAMEFFARCDLLGLIIAAVSPFPVSAESKDITH